MMVRGFLRAVWSIVADRLKTFIFIMGVGAVLGFGAKAVMQLYAEAVYMPAWATITGTDWSCHDGGNQTRPCRPEEIASGDIEGSERSPQFLVVVSYQDSAGAVHQQTMPTAWTGLTTENAQPGTKFGILYDPEHPETVSTRFGSEWRSSFIPAIGLVLMGISFFWWRSDRRKAKPEKAFKPVNRRR